MDLLITGLLLFFAPHMVSVINPSWRDDTAQRIGALGWKAAYSVLSLVGFWLIIQGYADARLTADFLYNPPRWMNHVAATLMLPVFILLLAAYLPGRIQSLTKHPMLIATKLWALSHLLANGRTSDVILFGCFLIWAVLVRISIKRRPVREVPKLPKTAMNDVIAVVAGLGLYVVFALHLHQMLIGVRPFG